MLQDKDAETAQGRGAALLTRVRPVDRLALSLWAGAWLGVMFFVAVVPRVLPTVFDGRPYLERWAQWDAVRFVNLATYGYDGVPGQPDPGWPAFFPGYPMLLRAVGTVVPDIRIGGLLLSDYRLIGLAISLVAGAVTMVALARIGEREGPEGTGGRAVVALLAGPPAVFLFAGYSEAVFLALALPAWLLARRGRWTAAALLAVPAAGVRITGLFFALALIVEFLVGEHGRREVGWRPAAWLALPFTPLLAYSWYQWTRTGDWLAWQHAQEAGWDRHLVWPWESFKTTWQAAFQSDYEFTLAFRIEMFAALVGVLLTVYLLVKRRWPELVYVGLQLAALLLSSYYLSVGRAMLLWWPLWIAVARFGMRRPGLYAAAVAVSTPFAVLLLLTFTSGSWAG
ncbi:Mannosyltransferase (PIG-V) [Thermomonospora echinospora]|uniref:Mannosyltransferase (PIG-V) n=1 Tax=Thermomonospora echinospora TaxID=1992 RepID=A0A1H6DCM5_9ACTN|nr:Mannosyltransferase (PIG-V) [Thermomonospora echinospora]